MIKTKFYTDMQNNSAGFFLINEKKGIGHFLIIEAVDNNHAMSIHQKIVEGFTDYCPCCGERWCPAWMEESEVPLIDGKPIEEYSHWFPAVAYLHKLDGTIEKYNIKEKKVN